MLETLREIRAQCGPEQRRPFVRGGYSSPVGWGVLEYGGEDPFSREKGMRLKDLWGKTPQGLIPGVGRLKQSQRPGVDSVQSTEASTDKASRRFRLSVSSVPMGF